MKDLSLTPERGRDIMLLAGLSGDVECRVVKQHNHVWELMTPDGSFFLKAHSKDWYGGEMGAAGLTVEHEVAAWSCPRHCRWLRSLRPRTSRLISSTETVTHTSSSLREISRAFRCQEWWIWRWRLTPMGARVTNSRGDPDILRSREFDPVLEDQ